jgi:thiol-disulfide isomerase/thioredoxin
MMQATKDKKPVLLVFWATWCAPCVAEASELFSLARKFEGVMFVGLADDVNNDETRSRMTSYSVSSGIRYQYILKDRSLLRKIFNEEDTPLPAFAVFDPNVNTFRLRGSIMPTRNRRIIEKALRAASQRHPLPKAGVSP